MLLETLDTLILRMWNVEYTNNGNSFDVQEHILFVPIFVSPGKHSGTEGSLYPASGR